MFGFVIPTCCRNELHISQLLRCISSIRKYHNNPIILVNDGDVLDNIMDSFSNVYIKDTLNKGSADQQVFKVFLETDMFDTMIYIQDSMILNKRLYDVDSISDVKFLWHFTNHRKQWDIIREPLTNITHTELIKDRIITEYYNYPEFCEFALKRLLDKHKWCGGFGSCCIITKECLRKLDSMVGFIDKFVYFNTNRLRRANESIFSLICHFVYPLIDFEDSYDGLYYNGVDKVAGCNEKTGFDGLSWCCQKTYLSKVSFNR
jgi:hypothetical protein